MTKTSFFLALCALGCLSAMADDRGMFSLKGNVQEVTIETIEEALTVATVVKFDKNGLIATIDNVEPLLTRDHQGRVHTVTLSDEDEDGELVNVVNTLIYGADGIHVEKYRQENPDETVIFTITYDAETGLPQTMSIANEGYDEPPMVLTYTYTDFDSNGNWTKRTDDGGATTCRKIAYR